MFELFSTPRITLSECVESKFHFVEFLPDITLQCNYVLKGLVRRDSSHCICAIYKQSISLCMDDISGKILHFRSLDDLYRQFSSV